MILFQYQAWAKPVPTPGGEKERITPDKWLPSADPVPSTKKHVYAQPALASQTALAFTPSAPFPERTTPDRWHPEIQRPKWDLKRQQSLYPPLFQEPKPITAVESITADKWHPEIQRPRWDVKRNQHTYPFFATNEEQSEPRLDSWGAVEVRQPIFDVKRWQYTYPVSVGAIDTTYSERTTPDKWHPELQRPRWDVKRNQYTYPVTAIPRNQPLPDLDSWVPETQKPLFDLKRQQFGYPYFATADRQSEPEVDSWIPETQKPRFDLVRKQYTYQTFALPEEQSEPRMDSWWQVSNTPRFDLRRMQHTYPAFSTADLQPVAPLDSYWQQPNVPLFDKKRQQFVYPTVTVGPVSATFPESNYPDKWHPELQRPRWDVKRQQYTYPFYVGVDRQAVPSADSWGPTEVRQPVFDVRRQQFVYPSWVGPVSNVFDERTTPDKWHPEIQRPRWDVKRNQYTYPDLSLYPFPYASPVFAGTWHPDTEKPRWDVKRQQYTYPFYHMGPVATTFTEVVSADRWHPELQRPRWDVKRQQYTYPFFAGSDKQSEPRMDSWYQEAQRFLVVPANRRYLDGNPFAPFVQAVTVDSWYSAVDVMQPRASLVRLYPFYAGAEQQPVSRLDSWWMQASIPRFDVRRQQAAYPAHVGPIGTTFGERITPDKWHPLSNVPLFDLKRQQFGYPYFAASEQQQVPDSDSWIPLSNVPLFDVRRQQFVYPALTFTQTAFAESVTSDRWHPEIQRPKFDLVRKQYTYPDFAFDPYPYPSSVFVDSWVPETQKPLFDKKRMQYSYWFYHMGPVSATFPESNYPDKWHPLLSVPLFDAKRIQQRYPFFFTAEKQAEPRFDWFVNTSTPLFDKKRMQERYLFSFFTQTAFAERASPDRWMPEIQRPRWDVKRQQYTYPDFAFHPYPYASPVFSDSWHPALVQPLFDKKRMQTTYPVTPVGPVSPTFGETIYVDKWGGLSVFSIDKKKSLTLVQPADTIFTGEVITADKWFQMAQMLPRNKVWLPFGLPTVPYRQPEPRIDSWFTQPQIRLSKRVLLPYEGTVAPLRQPESRMDSWYQQEPLPVRKQTRVYVTPVSVEGVTLPTPSVASWMQVTEIPRSKIKQVIAAYQPQTNAFATEEVTLDKWYMIHDPRIPAKRLLQYDSTQLVESREMVGDISWFAPTQTPVYIVLPYQYLEQYQFDLMDMASILIGGRKFDVIVSSPGMYLLIDGKARRYDMIVLRKKLNNLT